MGNGKQLDNNKVDKNQQEKLQMNGTSHHVSVVASTSAPTATTKMNGSPRITNYNDVNELDWLPKYRYSIDVQEQVNIDAKSMWEGVSFDDEDG